jgi:hypothetical protein
MVPGKYNINIFRGSTWSIHLGASDGITGVDFAATYAIIRIQVRPAWTVKPSDATGTPLFELSLVNGRIVTDATGMTLTISAQDTAKLSFNSGVYELEMTTDDPVPVVDKLLYGTVTVTGEITI